MKTMYVNQRMISRLLSVLLMAVMMVSCSKSSSDPAPSDAVVGNWKLSGYLVKENNDPEQDLFALLLLFGGKCITDLVYTFNADGTLSTNAPSSCTGLVDDSDFATKGKWAIVGSKFVTTDTKGVKDEYDYTASATELTLSQTVQETDPSTKVVTTTKNTIKFKKA